MPNPSPIIYAISMIHLPEYDSSASSSHLSMPQNTTAIISDDMEYNSPSTAENQKVSVKV